MSAIQFVALGQTQIKLMKDEKIKKENNLYGIYYNKEWVLPCKYDKIEAYEWNYIFAYFGNSVDVYSNSMGTWKKLLQGKLPIQYLDLYKSFANTDNYPIYEQGKWGFYNDIYRIEPQYDSLFVICKEGANGTNGKRDCNSVVGAVKNGVKGVVKNDGKEIVFNSDYISYKYIFDNAKENFYIIATHKSGVEVNYDIYYLSKNDFIITTDKNNLKGYVFNGKFVAPKYKSIERNSLIPITDYECVFPDGRVEYLKGEEVISSEKVAEYKDRIAKEELMQQQRQLKQNQFKDFITKKGLTKEIQTKFYSINIYPGWDGLFVGTENDEWLISSKRGVKKPIEIYNEAPEGWLKEYYFVSTMNILFYDMDSITTDEYKKDFFDKVMRRSKLPKDKIKPIEEKVTLLDGREALLLFYVYKDATGMVGGSYFNCELIFPSEKSPNSLTVFMIAMEGVPDLPEQQVAAWKDYFKNVLLSIRPK
ncbi:MAG: hypothetical protein M9958_08485 [Chitinophagales bacterium]|nr:hypothetical protein [Chitinophagales bacterium]